ncbi:AAA family ATPase [Azospirillum soli]|uniref:AAA family ATPase n=1 Tax=Azospirillum soli TaxID=1304799 RepID=UPI001AE273EC|nr:AAA family ATPase [Azospirillum soli]MBP2316726.1 pilus assembly protein CpaE [Azospirillum soli]
MSRRINSFALLRSSDCADELRSAFDAANAGRLDLRMIASSTPVRFDAPAGAEAILIELDPGEPGAVDALARFVRDAANGRPVIAIARDATVQSVRALMRAGALDVLPRPVSAGDLGHALEHARTLLAQRGRQDGRVVTVLRSCGGVGATTLAVQTALELVNRDRNHKARVCLADFDLQFGNAALSLDLGGTAGLMQILEAPARLDAAFLSSAVAHHASGLDVLAAPPEIVPHDTLTADMASRILALLREQYDFVVVDMPHAWTSWTSPVLAGSELVALVMRPDVTGVLRTQGHLKLIAEEELDDVPRLIVASQVEQGSAARQALKDAQAALGEPIQACIRFDAKAAAAAREAGKPLREVAAGSVIAKDTRAFAGLILSTLFPAAREVEAPRSALRRLFSLTPLAAAR